MVLSQEKCLSQGAASQFGHGCVRHVVGSSLPASDRDCMHLSNRLKVVNWKLLWSALSFDPGQEKNIFWLCYVAPLKVLGFSIDSRI